MSFFQVTSGELRKKADSLRGLNSRFKSGVDNLISTEQALKTMWEGEANDTFHSVFVKDKDQMDIFHEVIESFIEALFVIAARYEEAEKRNTATASTRTY